MLRVFREGWALTIERRSFCFLCVSAYCCGGRLPRRAGLDFAVSNLVSVRSILPRQPCPLALSTLSLWPSVLLW